MVGGYFEVSVNDPNFVTGVTKLPAITSQPADGLNTLNVSLSGTYRYVRYVSPNNSYCNISEMQVFGPGGTVSPIPVNKQIIGTPSSNTTGNFGNSGNTYLKAFDGNTRSFFDAPTANGNYIQLDLGSAQTICAAGLRPASRLRKSHGRWLLRSIQRCKLQDRRYLALYRHAAASRQRRADHPQPETRLEISLRPLRLPQRLFWGHRRIAGFRAEQWVDVDRFRVKEFSAEDAPIPPFCTTGFQGIPARARGRKRRTLRLFGSDGVPSDTAGYRRSTGWKPVLRRARTALIAKVVLFRSAVTRFRLGELTVRASRRLCI